MIHRNNPSKQVSDTKDSVEIVPDDLCLIIPPGLDKIIYDYYFDSSDMYITKDDNEKETKKSVWLEKNPNTYSFFGFLCKQILALIKEAAPLDQVERYIRLAHAKNEPHLQTTLMEGIRLAVFGLDKNIYSRNGKQIIHEGMAERLLSLHQEFFPQDQLLARSQAVQAEQALYESDKDQQEREDSNKKQINSIFNVYILNDQSLIRKILEIFSFNIKIPKDLPTNFYYLNQLQLLYMAFEVLARRGHLLPRTDEHDVGGWYGKLANQFCFQIIGMLQNDLPPRVRQLLHHGLWNVYNSESTDTRTIDIDGSMFRGINNTYSLGSKSYYDNFMIQTEECVQLNSLRLRSSPYGAAYNFEIFYKQLYASVDNSIFMQYFSEKVHAIKKMKL